MKIKLGTILRVLVQLATAAPVIIDAVRPVLDEFKRPKKRDDQDNGASKVPIEDRSAPSR